MKKLVLVMALISILVGCSNKIDIKNEEEVYKIGKEIEVDNQQIESEEEAKNSKEETEKNNEASKDKENEKEEVTEDEMNLEQSETIDETENESQAKSEGSSEEIDDNSQVNLTKEEVFWLQESLKVAGFYTALDGSFGPNTKAQLKAFKEEDAELLNDMIYNEKVKEKLQMIRHEKMIQDGHSTLILLNKSNYLSYTFVPKNLVEAELPKSKVMMLRSDVNAQAKAMFHEAKNDGFNLYMASGYRSYDYQETLFSRRVKNYGFEAAETVVAVPGQSEHQTGLAIDITTKEMGYGLSQSFDQTESFKWLKDNCHRYGFILRYQKGKENITGYIYEPWHYRYIGDIQMAKEIMEKGLVLEEYLQ